MVDAISLSTITLLHSTVVFDWTALVGRRAITARAVPSVAPSAVLSINARVEPAPCTVGGDDDVGQERGKRRRSTRTGPDGTARQSSYVRLFFFEYQPAKQHGTVARVHFLRAASYAVHRCRCIRRAVDRVRALLPLLVPPITLPPPPPPPPWRGVPRTTDEGTHGHPRRTR